MTFSHPLSSVTTDSAYFTSTIPTSIQRDHHGIHHQSLPLLNRPSEGSTLIIDGGFSHLNRIDGPGNLDFPRSGLFCARRRQMTSSKHGEEKRNLPDFEVKLKIKREALKILTSLGTLMPSLGQGRLDLLKKALASIYRSLLMIIPAKEYTDIIDILEKVLNVINAVMFRLEESTCNDAIKHALLFYCKASYHLILEKLGKHVSNKPNSHQIELHGQEALKAYQEKKTARSLWHDVQNFSQILSQTYVFPHLKSAMLYEQGRELRKNDRLDEAEEILNSAIGVHDDNPKAIVEISIVHALRGNFQGALIFLEEAIHAQRIKSKKYAYLYVNRELMYYTKIFLEVNRLQIPALLYELNHSQMCALYKLYCLLNPESELIRPQ